MFLFKVLEKAAKVQCHAKYIGEEVGQQPLKIKKQLNQKNKEALGFEN